MKKRSVVDSVNVKQHKFFHSAYYFDDKFALMNWLLHCMFFFLFEMNLFKTGMVSTQLSPLPLQGGGEKNIKVKLGGFR